MHSKVKRWWYLDTVNLKRKLMLPLCLSPSIKYGSLSVTSMYVMVVSPLPAKNSIFVSGSYSGIKTPVEQSNSSVFSGVLKFRKSRIMIWRKRAESNPVVRIRDWSPSHTTRESLILWWLSAAIVMGTFDLGSTIRTTLSLQLVVINVPSSFQLSDWITSGCSLLPNTSFCVVKSHRLTQPAAVECSK